MQENVKIEKKAPSSKKFILEKGPHIRRADFKQLNTKTMMIDVIIALIPLILFAWFKNGIAPFIEKNPEYNTNFFTMIYPLLFIIIGGGSAYLFEALYYLFFIKEEKINNKTVKVNPFKKSLDSHSIIPGLMLAMILPLNTPIWVLLLGVLFAIWVAKMLFGGFGYNLFNPALVGYVFVMTAFYGVITKNGGYFNPKEAVDAISSATPLGDFKEVLAGSMSLTDLLNNQGSLLNQFLGYRTGSLAETSGILCIVAFVYLVYKKVIDWKMPVIFVGSVFVLSYIVGAFIGYGGTLDFALFNILNGGVLYASVFMVTEPVTSPRNGQAKVFYALFIALLTLVLRFLSNMNEGVCTSILFMNMFTPMFDIGFAKLRVEDSTKKKIIGYGIYVLVAIAILAFIILRLAVK